MLNKTTDKFEYGWAWTLDRFRGRRESTCGNDNSLASGQVIETFCPCVINTGSARKNLRLLEWCHIVALVSMSMLRCCTRCGHEITQDEILCCSLKKGGW